MAVKKFIVTGTDDDPREVFFRGPVSGGPATKITSGPILDASESAGPGPIPSNVRITEAGDDRFTEDGQYRVVE